MQIQLRNLNKKQQPIFDENGDIFLLESYRHVAALECFPDFKGEAVLVRAIKCSRPWWKWMRVGEDAEITDIGTKLLPEKSEYFVSYGTEPGTGVL